MPTNLDNVDTDDAILLVPTAHVSRRSADRVKRTIERANPDTVAVELDEKRLERFEERDGLTSASISDFLTSDSTPTGALLTLFHRGVHSSLLEQQGLSYEDTDMFTAVRTAREQDTNLALIDRPFEEMREEVVLESDVDELIAMLLVLGIQYAGVRAAGDSVVEETEEASFDYDPTGQTSVRAKLARQIGGNVFRNPRDIILTGRNEYMVDELLTLAEENDTIVAVIGGAHLAGMRALLEEESDKDILTVVPSDGD